MKVYRAFALHCDVPPGRARAWNVAAALFVAGGLYAAYRLGVLGWVLAAVAGMVAVTAVVLARIAGRRADCPDRCRIPEGDAEHAQAVAWLATHRAVSAELVDLEPEVAA